MNNKIRTIEDLWEKEQNLKMRPKLKGVWKTEKDVEAIKNSKPNTLGAFVLGDGCDSLCLHCPTFPNRQMNKENLTKEEIHELLKDSVKNGFEKIYWAGPGEPFVDNRLLDLVKYASDLGLYSVIFTSGSRIDEKSANIIGELPVSVIASVKTFSPWILDYNNQKAGKFLEIFAGLHNLIKAGLNNITETDDGVLESRLAVDVMICDPIFKDYQGVEYLLKFCDYYNIVPSPETFAVLGRAKDFYQDLKLGSKANENLKRLRIKYPWAFEIEALDGACCDLPLRMPCVYNDGSVHPCFYIEEKIYGNIRKNSILEIWDNKDYINWRENAFKCDTEECPGRRHNKTMLLAEKVD